MAGCESDTRLAVAVTVADPAAPTGSSTQAFCAINNPTVGSLTATGTNIHWYSAPTGGAPLTSSTALVTGTSYFASQTVAGCESDTRLAVTVNIADPAAPTGSSTQAFCAINNSTIGSLTATGTNIQWYAAPTGGAPLTTSTALVTGTSYFASQTVAGCESDTRLAVTVTINPLPTIILGTNPLVCRGITSANLPYSSPSGSPNQYSIDYNAAANTAGFTDVTNINLGASPIVLTIPAAAPAAVYNAVLIVRNGTYWLSK